MYQYVQFCFFRIKVALMGAFHGWWYHDINDLVL
jgi:hypothetical protein